MPRQVDLNLAGFKVSHDPTQQLSHDVLKDRATIGTALRNAVIRIIRDLTGVDLTCLSEWLDQLAADFALDGKYGLQATVMRAINLFRGLDFNDPEAVVKWAIDQLFRPLVDWITGDDPFDAGQIIGTLFPGGIPVSELVSAPENKLWNGDFRSAISLVGGNEWGYSPLIYFSDSTGSGSAFTQADGRRKELCSNAIDVPTGKMISMSVQVLASGLEGTGTPVQLWVIPDGDDDAMEMLDATFPTGGSSGWANAPGGARSAVLNADYSPPEWVTTVNMLLVVDETATAGEVNFDNANAYVTGGWLHRTWTQVSEILDAYSNAETKEQFEAAFNLVLDLLDLPHPEDFWSWIAELFLGPLDVFVSKEFWDSVGVLFTKLFAWLISGGSGGSWSEVTAAWAAVAVYFQFTPPTALEFWTGVIRFIAGPWVSVTFINKAAALVHTALMRMNGTATQSELDIAWDEAWNATMTLETPESWQFLLRTVRIVSSNTTLLRAVWTYVFGTPPGVTPAFNGFSEAAVDELSDAWQTFLEAWGLANDSRRPDMTQFWPGVAEGAMSSFFPKLGSNGKLDLSWLPTFLADLDGFLSSVWGFVRAVWDYIFGGKLYSGTTVGAFSSGAGNNLSVAWAGLWGAVAPSGTAVPGGAAASTVGWNFLTKGINAPGNPGIPVLSNGFLAQSIIGATGWLTSGIDDANAAAGNALAAAGVAQGKADYLEGTVIPAADSRIASLESGIADADDRIHEIENVAIPAANRALTDMRAAIIASYGGPPSSQGQTVDNSEYSELINAGKSLQSIAKSGQTLGMNNASVLSIRNNKPLYQGLDSTSETSFPLPILGTVPPFFPATPERMNVGFLRVSQDSAFNMVSWLGYGTGLTSFWVEIFKMDIHGNMQTVYVSRDLMVPEGGKVGVDTSLDFAWNYHRLVDRFTGEPIRITAKSSEIYGAAFEIAGSGAAYNVVGNASWAPDHPYINPRTPGMGFSWGAAAWGFAEDISYEVEPTNPNATIVPQTFIRGAGPDQIVFMRQSPPAMFKMNIRDFGASSGYSNIEEITLPENVSGDALAVFADADGSYYFLQNTPERIVQRVSADGSATWMTVVTDIDGEHPELPQLNFSVGGMVVFPGGRVVLYENDHARLLSLDFNTFSWYQFPVDPAVDEVTAMCLNPQSSLLFIWNQSTQEIIWFSTRNYEMLGWRVMSIPVGFTVADIAADADGFAYLSLRSTALGGCILVRANLGTGLVQFVSSTPAVAPATIGDALVSGSGRMCVVNDRDVVAVNSDQIVVHRNVHYYDVADSIMTSGEPLPWFALGTLSDEESLLLPPASYDPAVPHPDLLVQLDPSGARTAIPDWVNTIFLIAVGAGGGGGGARNQDPIPSNAPQKFGFGGHGGAISIVTAYRGVHFLPGQDVWALTGTPGNGGAPGSVTAGDGTAGIAGSATRINVGFTIDAVIAAGGLGGAGAQFSNYGIEQGPVPITKENAAAGHEPGDTIESIYYPAADTYAPKTSPVRVKVSGSQVVLGGATAAQSGQRIAGIGSGGAGGDYRTAGSTGYGYPGGPGRAWAIFSQRIV